MELIEVAKIASEAAGKYLFRHLKDIKRVKTKNTEFDFVTKFDKGAEEIFFTILSRYYPDIPFLSEESGKVGGKDRSRFWVIDPLDGTSNYVRGVPLFSTSLALVEDKEPVLGVIYDPVREELFWAEKGKGAFLNGERIYASTHRDLKGVVLSTTFSYETILREKNAMYFEYFYRYAQNIRNIGSSALSLAYVARGRFDGYWTFSVSLWDIAAGAIIIKEAGGDYSTLSVGESDFSLLANREDKTIGFLGTNSGVFHLIYEILNTPERELDLKKF